MKQYLTVGVIVVLVIAFAVFLFKSSPQPAIRYSEGDFDLTTQAPKQTPAELTASDRVLGSRTAKNLLTVYEDFQCPACAAFAPVVKQVPTEIPDTAVVVRYFPLLQIHPNSVVAIFAAEAAGEQGKWAEMYERLFDRQNDWANLANPTDKFVEIAKEAGVADLDKFRKDATAEKYKDPIKFGLSEAQALQLQGTPSAFFNGKPIQIGALASIKSQAEAIIKAGAASSSPAVVPATSTPQATTTK